MLKPGKTARPTRGFSDWARAFRTHRPSEPKLTHYPTARSSVRSEYNRHCWSSMHFRLALLCVLAFGALVRADDVILKGGGRISGHILSRTEKVVEVDVGAGTVTVPMTSVVRIEQKRSVLDDYYERARALPVDDAAGWLQLGRWASSQGLGTQARTAFEQVLAIDPANVDANQALGRVLMDGRWVTQEEQYRLSGYVQFEGEWMMPEERDAILRERDAALQAEAGRLEAERRAQEAEARAAEAEARAREAETYVVPGYAGFPLYWGGYWGPGPAVWPSRPIATPPARPTRPIARPPARPPGRPPAAGHEGPP
jgi:hypothetical protein